jgi:primosomal protein N' (replication factor Y)
MVKGGLKLKRELAPHQPQPATEDSPVARVWVDASVYHLDQEFSYVVPRNLSESAQVGSLVSLPFHGREVIGVVLSRVSDEPTVGLKSITKVLGAFPLLTEDTLHLIRIAAARYAAHPFDLIRSAIPERMPTIEKEFTELHLELKGNRRPERPQYLQIPPAAFRAELLARKIEQLSKFGGVLTLLPDSKELLDLSQQLVKENISHVVLDSQLPKSEYYRNFLKVRTGQSTVVIGTRSAVFAPVFNLANILIYNEGSEHFYERRSPGWNARDIALVRSKLEIISLTFAGYSPSTEIGKLIGDGLVDFRRARGKVKVSTFTPVHGELLPSRAIPVIRKALVDGPVLFLVPLKGYAQAIRCNKCKTVSRCECGGAHEKLSATALITCNHCSQSIKSWKCVWCHEGEPSLISRGVERHLYEIGLLFPGISAHFSTSDHPISGKIDQGIILATPTMAPHSTHGYSAVVILEGNRFLNQPDMRATERVREMFFAHSALAKAGAPVILVQDEGNPTATAIATWNPTIALQRDLQERLDLHLPPYVRTASLTMENAEVIRLKNALVTALDEKRLPASTRILGPIDLGAKASLILTASISESDELVRTIHEFMRRRSSSKKPLPTLRIDPYSLSR